MSSTRVSRMTKLLIRESVGAGWGIHEGNRPYVNIVLRSIARESLVVRVNVCLFEDFDDPRVLRLFLDHYNAQKRQRRQPERKGQKRQRRREERESLFSPAWVLVGLAPGATESIEAAAVRRELDDRFSRVEAQEGWIYILLVGPDGRGQWVENPYKHLDALVARWLASRDGGRVVAVA